ncbi:topoisomerase C-terminal repeat-containing protein [Bacillus mycoides]|uniref:topoisomerase C-terminal repeat-containing protein n=1 Tax=Bacillus mycoides TaxID=1405 RepID=UPI0039F0EA75
MLLGKTILQKNMKRLLNGEQTDLIKGFKKGENVFDAKLVIVEKDYNSYLKNKNDFKLKKLISIRYLIKLKVFCMLCISISFY